MRGRKEREKVWERASAGSVWWGCVVGGGVEGGEGEVDYWCGGSGRDITSSLVVMAVLSTCQ